MKNFKLKKLISIITTMALACTMCMGLNLTASASSPSITYSEEITTSGNTSSINYSIKFNEELDLTKLEIVTTFVNATRAMNSYIDSCSSITVSMGYISYMNSITVSNTIVDTQQVSTYKFNTDYDVKGATMDIVTRTVYSDWTDIASDVVPTTVIKYDGKEIYPHQLLTPENSSQDMTIKATTKIPAPTYTVTIPASIDIGSVSGALEKYRNADTDKAGEKIVVEKPFTVYASGVENLFDGKKLFVSIGTADVATTMTGSDSTITCKLNKDGTSYTEGTEFASFVNDLDLAVGEQNIQKGSVLVNRCDIKTTADYTGTLTFNIEIKEGN